MALASAVAITQAAKHVAYGGLRPADAVGCARYLLFLQQSFKRRRQVEAHIGKVHGAESPSIIIDAANASIPTTHLFKYCNASYDAGDFIRREKEHGLGW